MNIQHQWFVDAASIWAARAGGWVKVVSANDHIHERNSDHYQDRAIDFHASDLWGLNDWLLLQGLETYWQVPGHFAHVHAFYGETVYR